MQKHTQNSAVRKPSEKGTFPCWIVFSTGKCAKSLGQNLKCAILDRKTGLRLTRFGKCVFSLAGGNFSNSAVLRVLLHALLAWLKKSRDFLQRDSFGEICRLLSTIQVLHTWYSRIQLLQKSSEMINSESRCKKSRNISTMVLSRIFEQSCKNSRCCCGVDFRRFRNSFYLLGNGAYFANIARITVKWRVNLVSSPIWNEPHDMVSSWHENYLENAKKSMGGSIVSFFFFSALPCRILRCPS